MPAPLMTAPSRGALTAVTAALLALAAFLGPDPTAALVLLFSLAFAWGFPSLMRASAPRGVSLVIGLTAIAATTVEIVVPEEGLLTVVLAFGVVGTFLQQMFRRDGRPRLAESVSVAVSGIIVVISGAGWITAVSQVDGLPLVLVTAAALALAAGSMYLPGPSSIAVIAACAAPTVVAALLGGLLPAVEPVPAALLGFAAGTMVAATHILFLRFRSLPLPSTGLAAAVLAPLALGLPVAQLAAFVL